MFGMSNNYSLDHWLSWLNPLYVIGIYGNYISTMLSTIGVSSLFNVSDKLIAAGIVTPTYWAIIFLVLGLFVFKRSDVK